MSSYLNLNIRTYVFYLFPYLVFLLVCNVRYRIVISDTGINTRTYVVCDFFFKKIYIRIYAGTKNELGLQCRDSNVSGEFKYSGKEFPT